MFKSSKNNLACFAEASQAVPQLVERIFTNQHGRQFKLVFLVAIVDGELKGKLVSAQPISSSDCLKLKGECSSAGSFFLPVSCEKEAPTGRIFYTAPVTSPYVSLEYLITSQPTRAPSK